MKIILLVFSLTFNFFLSINSWADESNAQIHGVGTQSCGKFIDDYQIYYRDSDLVSTATYQSYLHWLGGALTQSNLTGKYILDVGIKELDVNSAMLAVKNFCEKNPSSDFATAVFSVTTKIYFKKSKK